MQAEVFHGNFGKRMAQDPPQSPIRDCMAHAYPGLSVCETRAESLNQDTPVGKVGARVMQTEAVIELFAVQLNKVRSSGPTLPPKCHRVRLGTR